MKRFAIAAAALLWSTPAMAHHLHTRDGVEIEPSHCVFDGIFETWNCWYTPVPKRSAWPQYRQGHHHHHRSTYRTPYFNTNRHNEHGVPCYFYKKNGWCF